MKKLILIIASIFICIECDSQILFSQEKLITKNYDTGTELGFGDIDNNSLMDVFVSKGSNLIRYEMDPNTNEFVEIGVLASSTSPFFNIRIIDFDQDGFLDILYRRDNNKIIFKKGISLNGDFENELILFNSYSTDLDIVDFDHDGDLDILVCTDSQYSQISWYENQGQGESFNEIEGFENYTTDVNRAIIIDINQDGHPDVVTETPKDVRYFQNDGNGYFGNGIKIFSSFWSFDINTHDRPIDINQDGKLDIVLDTKGTPPGTYNGLYWFENNGSFFVQDANFIQDFYGNQYDFIDFDGDGDLDLINYSFDILTKCRTIIIREKINGSDNFASPLIISEECHEYLSSTLNMLKSAYDLDGDGDYEIIGKEKFGERRVFWLENLSELPILKGAFFYDDNLNGLLDTNEDKLSNMSIHISPAEYNYIISDKSGFNLRVHPGNHIIIPNIPNFWNLTNSTVNYSINVDYYEVHDGLDFGLIPSESIDSISIDITSAPTRCGFQVPFYINHSNSGTNYSNSLISFEIDPLCNMISLSPNPDSFENNIYYWYYENITPFDNEAIDAVIEMPGVEHLGDSVFFNSKSYIITNQNDIIQSSSKIYSSQINCAYDPNDKLVFPSGVGDDKQTLMGSKLEYTIRFQNTGSDTAFNILINDFIDENLDLNSFQLVSTSHTCKVLINNTSREVNFKFDNILLPDSLTNEIESHGFVKYKIDHHPVEEGQKIFNFASIFFDFNPPITTNTVVTKLVSTISNNNSEEQPPKINIYPNPSEDKLYFSESSEIHTVQIFYPTGQLAKSIKMEQLENSYISIKELPVGIYYFILKGLNSKFIQAGIIYKIE